MAVRSSGQSSEHDSSVSGPSRRPGLHPRQTLPRPSNYHPPVKTPPRLASTTRTTLGLSPLSHTNSSRSGTTGSSVTSAVHFMSDPNMPQSNAPSVWEGDGDASTTFEMETEVAELNDMVDEDVGIMTDSPTTVLIAYYCYPFFPPGCYRSARRTSCPHEDHHCIQASPRASSVKLCISATRIASRAQASQGHVGFGTGTATQERAGEGSRPPSGRLSNGGCVPHVYGMPLTRSQSQQHEESMDIARALRGDGRGVFNEAEVDELCGPSSSRTACDCE
jgi:hypothetical protein